MTDWTPINSNADFYVAWTDSTFEYCEESKEELSQQMIDFNNTKKASILLYRQKKPIIKRMVAKRIPSPQKVI
jgi:hypothetical protein